jgi:hypothetical protein
LPEFTLDETLCRGGITLGLLSCPALRRRTFARVGIRARRASWGIVGGLA